MIRTNISLHQEQYDLIKKESEATGCSFSWFLRELVDEHFDGKVKRVNVVKTEFAKPFEVPKEIKNKVKRVENLMKDIPKPRGMCKVEGCGAGLKPGGDFCMGKGNHKQ